MEVAEQPTSVEEPVTAAAQTDAHKMFKYSEYVDVGEGATECQDKEACADPEHFHGWCRLPNPYQHEDIRKKALAAKARKIRELRDRESDASVILDQDLADLHDPLFAETIIDELLAREWADDFSNAMQDVEEREEFEHIVQDREEFNRLRATEGELDEAQQSEDFKRLGTQISAYTDAIRKRLEEIQEPKRDELRQRDIEAIVEMVRTKRVEEEADKEFIETYNAWQWFVGTLRCEKHPTLGRPHLPMWDEIGVQSRSAPGTMFGEAPEVIEALKTTFNDLQIALQRGSAGN